MESHSCGLQRPATAHQPGAAAGRNRAASPRLIVPVQSAGHAVIHRVPGLTSWSRILASAALGALTIMILLLQYQFRHAEAVAAAAIYNLITPTLAATQAPIIWFGLGRPGSFGLLITPDCSAALLLVPLLLLGMGLVVPLRLRLRRVIGPLAVGSALLASGNLLRIASIALAIKVGGPGIGYQVGHLVIGSGISVVFIGVSLILMTVIITSRRGGQASLAALPDRKDEHG